MLLLLLYFKHLLPRDIWFMTAAIKDSKSKSELVHEMKLDSVLPVFHVVIGCDTESQFTQGMAVHGMRLKNNC